MTHWLIILLSLLTFQIFLRYRRNIRLVEKIPGPRSLPFLGNLLLLYGDAEYLWNILSKCVDQYYPITRLWVTPTSAFVLIRDPNDLEILLSSKVHINKGVLYDVIKSWAQEGIVVCKGEKSLHRRKFLTPVNHIDNLRNSTEIINKHADKLIEYIKFDNNESTHDVFKFTSDTVLDIFSEALCGIDSNNLNNEIITKFKKAVPEMLNIIAYKIVRPYIISWMMPFLNVVRKEKQLTKELHNLRDEIIKERKNYHKRTQNLFLQGNDNDTKSDETLKVHKVMPMLDHYLKALEEGFINQQELEEDVDNFLIAGTDTTATSMAFALMLLAENKEVQDRARIEVSEILDQTGKKIGMSEVRKFEYLDRCIKEALRLFPAASIVGRQTQEDIQLKNYLVPSGHNIICMIYKTHRDPKIWPEPNKFDPDRFLPENVKHRHPYAYLPFSAGPRECFGKKLAMLQMKILMAKILYNFTLEPVDVTSNLKFRMHVLLRPTNPVQNVKFINILK